MVKEGFPFVIIPLIIGLSLVVFGLWVIAAVVFLIAAFMAYFFRDPARAIPAGDNLILSAADGRVTRIENNETGKLVSVFLSPLNVHINRSPITGIIEKIEYIPGNKGPATNDKASLLNERNSLTIVGERMTVVCTQIAGILARRIVCWNKEGDNLESGEKFGMIKFGSRTDLLMPSNVEVRVKVGDKVTGGETIIASLPENNVNGIN
jgi:phosphatidylserine decarboxylase